MLRFVEMISRFSLLVVLLFFNAVGYAQIIPPETVNWQKVRNAEPDGLSLKLDLPKTRFYQGEPIEVTLTFSNISTVPYHLWIGTYDRSGRIPDIGFYAIDADGKFAPDPLRWYFERGGVRGGLGGTQDLGEWKIALVANQWVNFNESGSYKLFAYSNRVKKGNQLADGKPQEDSVELVSDFVTISIDPLSPADEQRIITEALGELSRATGNEAGASAVETLRYLGTPAARAALLSLLNGPQSFDVAMAIYAAPDPGAEAARVLDAVHVGKLKLDQHVVSVYTTLKTAGLRSGTPPLTKEAMETLSQKFQTEWKASSDEITAAALAASGGKGPDYNQALITTLFGDPVKRPQVRAELVTLQLDLTREQADAILNNWRDFGGDDFLPLIRKAVEAPAYSPAALIALSKIKPDEARPLIIEDIQRPSPRYRVPNAVPTIANAPLLSLPAGPIPELEPFFREQLAKGDPANLDLLIAAIDRYGAASLLPDVITFYRPKEGRWSCDIESDFLRFWLRYNIDGGLEALKRALSSRAQTHCYAHVLGSVLLDQWNEKALPIVTAALDDPETDVVISAIKILEAHTDSASLDPCIAALRRIEVIATKEHRASYATQGAARFLLQSTHWRLSVHQRQQLESLVSL